MVGLTERIEGRTFFYEQRYKPSVTGKPAYIKADHADDIMPMQGAHLTNLFGSFPAKITENDKIYSEIMFNAWANFGLHGLHMTSQLG
jgi:carboxylesterase type B